MTQAQVKCTTIPEAGERNSGPRMRFLGESTPLLGLEELERSHLYRTAIYYTTVLLETRMEKKKKIDPQCYDRHISIHIKFLPSFPALVRRE